MLVSACELIRLVTAQIRIGSTNPPRMESIKNGLKGVFAGKAEVKEDLERIERFDGICFERAENEVHLGKSIVGGFNRVLGNFLHLLICGPGFSTSTPPLLRPRHPPPPPPLVWTCCNRYCAYICSREDPEGPCRGETVHAFCELFHGR